MVCSNEFSIVTKNYLARYYDILDEMIQGMTSAELCDSISHNFIVQMIPHHKAAIEMSRNLLQYTTFIPLQNIALGIIEEQTKSIAGMEAALCRCSQHENTQQELCLYTRCYQSITKTMFTDMKNARSTNNINASFMREMIPHHRGAVEMSENALHYPICPQLVSILEAIISSQKKGIREMEQLLSCL